jgi:hypothetical protein
MIRVGKGYEMKMRKKLTPILFMLTFFVMASLLPATNVIEKIFKCAICGHESKQWQLMSTNGSDDNDLDSRPLGMVRDTIIYDVRRCPRCGYCAEDISVADDVAKNIVKTAIYKRQLHNKNYPELANSFLCMALIEKEQGCFSDAASTTINAAWACDDKSKEPEAAITCRKAAIGLIRMAEKAGQPFIEDEITNILVQVDLLRRSRQFGFALELMESKKEQLKDVGAEPIINFQKKLCMDGDIGCYKFSDAFEAHQLEAEKKKGNGDCA